jgi:hypothetical protein
MLHGVCSASSIPTHGPRRQAAQHAGEPLLHVMQDCEDAMGVLELTEALALQRVTSHDWHMQPCCALTGEGLAEGFGWISQRVHRHLKHGSG